MNIPYPYHLTSAEQNRRMDKRTINEFGIDGFTLMEIAGTRAADFILSETDSGSQGLFLCGKGNNAGDALVVARLLSQQGYRCSIFFVLGDDAFSEDTQKNLNLLNQLEGEINFVTDFESLDFRDFDFLVDGIFGTGLNSEVREPAASVIKSVNETSLPIFALDLPSGLEADTGRILGSAIKADFTLTFGAVKAGFYLNDGFDISGEVVLCDLPFPNQFREHAAYLIDESWAAPNRCVQDQRKHKYDEGVLYIIAGSEGLTGAAMMCAKSAWNQNLGAVVLITPKGLLDIYEKNLLQIIKKPVGKKSDLFFTEEHTKKVLEILNEKKNKVIIGPGLGRNESTIAFVETILSSYHGDVVIDADALFAVSRMKNPAQPKDSEWILTPHTGELATLLSSPDISKDDFNRMVRVSGYSSEFGFTVLSKGMPSIVATKNGQACLTGYDTRIFSRAGFGDILAGKIGAFWLQEKNPELACVLALLDGKDKAEQHIFSTDTALEPLDII
jgi:NAD(P)H-hydrate epimerase